MNQWKNTDLKNYLNFFNYFLDKKKDIERIGINSFNNAKKAF